MPRNIEIKARLPDLDAMRARVQRLADRGPEELTQDDTFFHCPEGRLKLRVFSPDDGQLIFYRRADESGPKTSFYILSPTSAPESLREALTLAYGQVGRVRKHRTVYWAGRTRIHLDRVEDLGTFLELEVVLEPGEPIEAGEAEAERLMRDLGIAGNWLLRGAYLDLLAAADTDPA